MKSTCTLLAFRCFHVSLCHLTWVDVNGLFAIIKVNKIFTLHFQVFHTGQIFNLYYFCYLFENIVDCLLRNCCSLNNITIFYEIISESDSIRLQIKINCVLKQRRRNSVTIYWWYIRINVIVLPIWQEER